MKQKTKFGRRFLHKVTALSMAFLLAAVVAMPTYVTAADDLPLIYEEFVIRADQRGRMAVSNVTMNEVQVLIDKRVEAAAVGDMDMFNELTQLLREVGVREATAEDFSRIYSADFGVMGIDALSTRSNIIVEVAETVVYMPGVGSISAIRFVLSPCPWISANGFGTLIRTNHYSGATHRSFVGNMASAVLSVASVAATGISFGTALSVFSAFTAIGIALQPTTPVLNMNMHYLYHIRENAQFLYFFCNGINFYRLVARYHRAHVVMSATAVNAVFSPGGGTITTHTQLGTVINRWLAPSDFGSIIPAIVAFQNNRTHTSSIRYVVLRGVNDQVVASYWLDNPTSP